MDRLKGKRALITGGSSGIGLEILVLLPLFSNPASIILNASINAHIGMPNTSVYGATKGALLALVRTLSGELISRGIRVNAISPGPIATPRYGKLGLSEADLKATSEALRNQLPIKRFGKRNRERSGIPGFGRIRLHRWE